VNDTVIHAPTDEPRHAVVNSRNAARTVLEASENKEFFLKKIEEK
jgi:hypothetical protein